MDVAAGKDQVPELEEIDLTNNSNVVLITTDHISDEAAAKVALMPPAPYIGMIGSLEKCRTILGNLRAAGFSSTDLERIYAPIGLDLGGNSPQEIAVGILAEVVAACHCGPDARDAVRFRRIKKAVEN